MKSIYGNLISYGSNMLKLNINTKFNSRVTIFNFVISGLHSRYPKNMIAEGCARFAESLSELTKTWSSGATECRV